MAEKKIPRPTVKQLKEAQIQLAWIALHHPNAAAILGTIEIWYEVTCRKYESPTDPPCRNRPLLRRPLLHLVKGGAR